MSRRFLRAASLAVSLLLTQAAASAQTPQRPEPLLPTPAPSGPVEAPTPLSAAADTPAPAPAGAPPASPGGAEAAAPQDAPSAPAAAKPKVRSSSPQSVGWLTPAEGGLGPDIWHGGDTRAVNRVMRTIRKPIASRWMHVLLRRALVSEGRLPRRGSVGDIMATRALLLLRQGDAAAAKRLIDRLGLDRATRLAYLVAPQAQLAAGDIPALCPLTETGPALYRDPQWRLLAAICAAVDGDDGLAAVILDEVREKIEAQPLEIQLADQLTTLLAGGNHGVNVEWTPDLPVTTVRLGLALAGRVGLPPHVPAQLSPAAKAWIALDADAPLGLRYAQSGSAALAGALPLDAMITLWAAHADTLDLTADQQHPTALLRTAYVGARPADRITAMRALWRGKPPFGRLVGLLATARAAARLPTLTVLAPDAPELVRAMALGGETARALAWWPVLANGDADARARAWPLLAALDRGGRIPLSIDLLGAWEDSQAKLGRAARRRHGAMLAAVFNGLGVTIPGTSAARLASRFDLDTPDDALNSVLASAAAAPDRAGELIVRCARLLAVQPAAVDPPAVSALLAALRTAGFVDEARLIGAELLVREGL